MPGFDKTGPTGEGPMTGRRMGACADQDGNIRPGRGFGFRFRGRNRGFGRGNTAWPEQFHNSEIEELKERIRKLESMLSDLESNKRN
jgi:hypothetical protein